MSRNRLGTVLTDVGFTLARNPDTVRAPDIAFIRQERLPANPRGFCNGPPDLAVEVLSGDDRRSEVAAKIEDYLAHGVRAVVVIDPDAATVEVVRRGRPGTVLAAPDARVELSDVVPGFGCDVREILD